jgi:alkylation response protein AidB-like acyl-CoA dehydrogenase
VVLEELGRALACVPYLSSCVIAPTILLDGAEELAEELLPLLADGRAMAAVALGDEALLGAVASTTLRARSTAQDRWRVSGEALFVADAAAADHLFVVASRPEGGVGWFVVRAGTDGVTVTSMPVIDTTRGQARVLLADAEARIVSLHDDVDSAIGPVLDAALTGRACEQSAAARFLLEITVDYAKTRYQFGQPIGSFQAIQHRLAELAVTVDTSVSAVEYAVWAAAEDLGRWREAASIAGFTCAEALHVAALEAIQLHGGIGFTWEHVAHRYYRRALASRVQFGAPSRNRERLLQALAI